MGKKLTSGRMLGFHLVRKGKVYTPKGQTKVDELIDPDGKWDEDIL